MNAVSRTLVNERSQPLFDLIHRPTNKWRSTILAEFSSVFLRLALAGSFLSAVADRFGLWGVYGSPNVAWGSYPDSWPIRLNSFGSCRRRQFQCWRSEQR
jgi:hypothetical protein